MVSPFTIAYSFNARASTLPLAPVSNQRSIATLAPEEDALRHGRG
jgi:hypothetical protein